MEGEKGGREWKASPVAGGPPPGRTRVFDYIQTSTNYQPKERDFFVLARLSRDRAEA